MGSVKDLEIITPAYENRPGKVLFDFSDRYSVFDWGEMPDQIKNKGSALAVMAAYNFERLEERGIPTHYQGLIVNDGLVGSDDLELGNGGSNIMEVQMAVRYDPVARKFLRKDGNPQVEYDYSFFKRNMGEINNFLVPLEIIFRNGLPKGSSVFKKLAKARGDSQKTREILDKLGLREIPKEGDMLPIPVLSYTTKLEEGDRNLTRDEAYYISGLRAPQFRKIRDLALKVNDFVTSRAEQTGLAPHWDGKVEMIYIEGELVLVDVIGTLDEDRFGDRISKEFLRQWYKTNQPGWAELCDKFKASGEGWQQRCPVKPKHLPEELSTLVSQMYMSACNQYVDREIFPNTPELNTVMQRLGEFRD
tara:strand:- start:1765 stop:2850 length:1086 start_codon:yes stop_codon:yes gene_type:complete